MEAKKESTNLILNHHKIKKHINENFVVNDGIKKKELIEYFEKREYFEQIDIKTDYADILKKATANAIKTTKFNFLKNPAKYEAILNKNQDEVYIE